eukprot:760533_1
MRCAPHYSDIGNKNDAIDAEIYVYLNRIIGATATQEEEEELLPPESPNTQQTLKDIFAEHDEMKATAESLQSSFDKHDEKESKALINQVDMNATSAKLANNLGRRPGLQSLKEHNILKA